MLRHLLAPPLYWTMRATRFLRQPGFRCLLLHDIPDGQIPAFERLVDLVARDYGTLSPDEAARWLDGAPPQNVGRAPCLFTFDDGFASNHRVAVEILDRRDIKALFFVCPGLIDLPRDKQGPAVAETVFRGQRADAPLLMDWNQIRDLHARGHGIGAHGMTHQRLSDLTGDALGDEIAGAAARLEEELGIPIPWFAYAFGDIDSVSAEALSVIAESHPFCRSGVRGANDARTRPLCVRADHVDLAAPEGYVRLVLEGGLDAVYGGARARLDAMA